MANNNRTFKSSILCQNNDLIKKCEKTHLELIPIVCDDLPVLSQLHGRFMKYVLTAIHSNYEYIHLYAMPLMAAALQTAIMLILYPIL